MGKKYMEHLQRFPIDNLTARGCKNKSKDGQTNGLRCQQTILLIKQILLKWTELDFHWHRLAIKCNRAIRSSWLSRTGINISNEAICLIASKP